jgi:cytochrome c oxidase cbb3-type subunit 3
MTEENKIAGHAYDNIEELDNPLPRWWLLTFYGTIAFSVVYFFYYTLGDGPGLTREWQKERAQLELTLSKNSGGNGPTDENALLAVVKDLEKQKSGKSLYQTRCASCHGAEGQGGIGPNLTDNYWIHGGKPAQVLATITNGVGDKGMPPWGGMLNKDELNSLVAFVKSINGTNPAGAKAPQGDLVKE